MAFELPALPYAKTALEPYTSANTLDFHHGKHHQTYVTNLNNLVKDTPMASQSLEQIIQATAKDEKVGGLQKFKDDFKAAAEKLTVKDDSGRVSRYGLGSQGDKYFDFVGANGGGILDDMFNSLIKDEAIFHVITTLSRHNDVSLIIMTQNLYQMGKYSTTLVRNCLDMLVRACVPYLLSLH